MPTDCKVYGNIAHHDMNCDLTISTDKKTAPKDTTPTESLTTESQSTDSYLCKYNNNNVYDKICVSIPGPFKSLEQYSAELEQIGAKLEKMKVEPKIEVEPKIDVEQKEEKVPVKWGPFF